MLIDFYGLECPHCHRMDPLVEKLEKETGVKVERVEVWHNDENHAKMEEYDQGLCGGVPFFYNTETKQFLCGESTYEELKNWAAVGPDKLN